MVAPGAAGTSFDVLLEFSLDQAANDRVAKRITSIQEELKRIEQNAKSAGKAVNETATATAQKTEAAEKSVVKLGAALAKLGERAKTGSKQTNEAIDSNIRKLKELEAQASKVRQTSALVSGTAARGMAIFGQGLLLGGALTGGILAEANRFAKEVQDTERATDATRAWTAATRDLAQARARVDTVLLRESLPLLQQAARIAEQAASFIEKHPELVQAALKTGVIVAGLSAVGLAVSKGIKLVADTAYISAVATELIAAQLQNKAADKQLAAATKGLVTNRADDLRKSLLGGGATGLAGKLTSPLGIGSIVTASVGATAVLSGILDKMQKTLDQMRPGAGGQARSFVTTTLTAVPAIGPLLMSVDALKKLFPSLQELSDEHIGGLIDKMLGIEPAAKKAEEGLEGLATAANSVNRDQLIKAFDDYQRDELEMTKQYHADRRSIVEDSLAEEKRINQNFAQSAGRIRRQAADAISDATEEYQRANIEAEQNYQQQRADIIQGGNEEIRRIQEQLQETLRKSQIEHNRRVTDLTAARDALGLAKEDERFRDERSEARRQANQEIAQRRREIAQRLADLAVSYAQERAQRQVDFQARVAEIRENAAQQIAELSAQHAAELKQIREQRVARIKELDAQFTNERQRRYQFFIQQIRDLDASLLGEKNLRNQYQTQMLQDLDAFLANYKSKLGSLSAATPTPRAFGGYASYGLHLLGDNPSGGRGPDEYVIKGLTTQAAERIVGGKINDALLLSGLRALSAQRSATYIDQRRIDGNVSAWSRRDMQAAAEDALSSVFGR